MARKKTAPIGKKFNYLTVIEEVKGRPRNCGRVRRQVICECDCGHQKTYTLSAVTGGHVKSCGCKKIELSHRKHGMHKSPEYITWQKMKARCLNPRNKKYHIYGGNGISVCERWIDSFENFYFDMGPRPTASHSIDRYPNQHGNYEPENCRWATTQEQNWNLSTNNMISWRGHTKCAGEWAHLAGKDASTLRRKKNKHRTSEILGRWLPDYPVKAQMGHR